ncbi:hypothetical protein GOV11_04995 [Candidatus Woesearchaeota archaeon]|nr:hypothetical protein [Candidatus Woesearchaeota archaeon]
MAVIRAKDANRTEADFVIIFISIFLFVALTVLESSGLISGGAFWISLGALFGLLIVGIAITDHWATLEVSFSDKGFSFWEHGDKVIVPWAAISKAKETVYFLRFHVKIVLEVEFTVNGDYDLKLGEQWRRHSPSSLLGKDQKWHITHGYSQAIKFLGEHCVLIESNHEKTVLAATKARADKRIKYVW